MNINKLQQLISNEEGFKLDFKLKLSLNLESEKKEFVKDVIAIANTVGGRGYIIFGIEDKTKRVVGIESLPQNIEERMQQIIGHRTDPPIPIQFELLTYKDKCIGVLTIFKSAQAPHQMLGTGGFYIRRGSTTGIATRQEIARMFQHYGMLSFETVPCRHAKLEDLDLEMIRSYLGIVAKEEQAQVILHTLGIIAVGDKEDKYYPTYGGLLLFGKEPQKFIPQALLEVQLTDKTIGIKGNILNILKEFETKTNAYLPKGYPMEALKEVVGNAMIHRDYWNNYLYTCVIINEQSIRVINPSQYSYKMNRQLKIRTNPWLYSRLLLLEEKKESLHFGIGIEKVKELFKSQAIIEIDYNQEDSLIEVKLPGTRHYMENKME